MAPQEGTTFKLALRRGESGRWVVSKDGSACLTEAAALRSLLDCLGPQQVVLITPSRSNGIEVLIGAYLHFNPFQFVLYGHKHVFYQLKGAYIRLFAKYFTSSVSWECEGPSDLLKSPSQQGLGGVAIGYNDDCDITINKFINHCVIFTVFHL